MDESCQCGCVWFASTCWLRAKSLHGFHRICGREYLKNVHGQPSTCMAATQLLCVLLLPCLCIDAIPIEVNAQWQIVLERLRLIVFFDPSTLSTRSSADRQCRFTIDVIVGQKDRTGRVFATPPSRISGACDGAVEERKWIEIPLLVETRSQTVSLRAVIRDKASGRLGSVDIPVNAIARRK